MAFGKKSKRTGKLDLLGNTREREEQAQRYEEQRREHIRERERILGGQETVDRVLRDHGEDSSDQSAVGSRRQRKGGRPSGAEAGQLSFDVFAREEERLRDDAAKAKTGQLGFETFAQEDLQPIDDETRSKAEGEVIERVRRKMRDQFGDKLSSSHGDAELEEEIRDAIDMALQMEKDVRTVKQRESLTGRIYNLIMGLGPLEEIFSDEGISEIMVSRYDKVFIERGGKMVLSDVRFSSEEELRLICDQIVSRVGRAVNDAHPLADARLADGSRVNIALPPVSVDGTTLTIRRFPKKKMKPEDYLAFGSCDERMLAFFKMAIEGRFTMIVSGGTGSGKTSLLNLLSNYYCYDPGISIITIEDSCELQIHHNNVRRYETRDAGASGAAAVTARDLVRNSLRQRPDVIILGEIRDGTIVDFFRAASTGHEGSLTTIHTTSPEMMTSTVLQLVQMAKDVNFSEDAALRMYAGAIDVLVQIERSADYKRRITRITHIAGFGEDGARALGISKSDPEYDPHKVYLKDIFRFVETGMSETGEILGRYEPTGYMPKDLLRKAFLNRVQYDKNIFVPDPDIDVGEAIY